MSTTIESTIERGALKLRPASEYVSVSPITMRRLIKRGLIKANRSTRHILIPVAELKRFLEGGTNELPR
jgi:excisionase family DNA binding protein